MFGFLVNSLPRVIQGVFGVDYQKFKNVSSRCSHSATIKVNLPKMKVTVMPALSDNYMYLITDEATRQAAVVDPVSPDVVLEVVENLGINLNAVLTTHHHWDHAGGNEELVKRLAKPLEVYGGDERIGALTHEVTDGEKLKIGTIDVTCVLTPCHTTGHVCYYIQDTDGNSAVFTGDTLFVGGCGKFFEGTPEQMYTALVEKLAKLPDYTLVFGGHENSQQNLEFARYVEKENRDILRVLANVKAKRNINFPTVPSTIAEERRTNPFMRVMMGTVQRHAACHDAISTMRAIRKEKDSFKR